MHFGAVRSPKFANLLKFYHCAENVHASFWATVCETVRRMLSDRCPVCLSECDIHNGVLWPNGWMGQDVNWYGGRPRPRPHCVRWGPSSPHGKGQSSPNFRSLRARGFSLRRCNSRPLSIVARRLDGSRCRQCYFSCVFSVTFSGRVFFETPFLGVTSRQTSEIPPMSSPYDGFLQTCSDCSDCSDHSLGRAIVTLV